MNLWQFIMRFLRNLFNWQEAAAEAVRANFAPSESVARPIARAAYQSIRQATIYRDLPDFWIPHAQVPIRNDVLPFRYETEVLAVWEADGIQHARRFTVQHDETLTFREIQALVWEQLLGFLSSRNYGPLVGMGDVGYFPVSVVRGYWR